MNELTVINGQAKRISTNAIEAVHTSYYDKGGIRDAMQTLDTAVQSAAQHVYALALYAAKKSKTLDAAAEVFGVMCDHAETTYKKAHEVDNLREVLPTWATYKSNVLRGLRAGVTPLEAKSERVFRARTMERLSSSQKKLTGPTASSGNGHAKPQVLEPTKIEGFLETTAIPDPLRMLVSQLVFAVEVVKKTRLEQAEEILRDAWQKLGALSDQRKLAS